MKFKIYLLFVLLSFSLAFAAVDLEIAKTDYNGDEEVSLIVKDCGGFSTVTIKNPSGDNVDMSLGNGVWTMKYHTKSDSSDGKYSAEVSCDDATLKTINFCVDDNDCVEAAPVEEEEEKDEEEEEEEVNATLPPPKQGGGADWDYCPPQWSCGEWSYCTAELQQTRTCVDLKNCEPMKTENKTCSKCIESWVCSIWSNCANNRQIRTCTDEHSCGSIVQKPELQKSCAASTASGPQPKEIVQSLPPPKAAKPTTQIPSPVTEPFWKEYKTYLIAVPSILLFITILIVSVVLLRRKPKSGNYNYGQLKTWIKKEKEMGTSNEDVRHILAEKTGWTHDEINRMFTELQGSEKVPVNAGTKPSNGNVQLNQEK